LLVVIWQAIRFDRIGSSLALLGKRPWWGDVDEIDQPTTLELWNSMRFFGQWMQTKEH
jgi:hypothetical protein